MIPLSEPNLTGREASYLQECIDSGFVSSVGPFVRQFEEHVSTVTESTSAVAVSSGTSGLHLSLVVAGVLPGDLVVIPSFTFIATANAIAQCGADPWLFDIDVESWTLNPDQVKEQLSSQCRRADGGLVLKRTGQRIAAIVPVYTLGLPANMDPLADIAKRFGIPLVADAAAAMGAKYQGRGIGDLADLSVASFNGNKTITCGGGGAVFGTDDAVLMRALHLSTTARTGPGYSHDAAGFNYRMTNLQAAVGCAQYERLNDFLQRKAQIRSAYRNLSDSVPGVGSFPNPPWAQSTNWLSGLLLRKSDHTEELLNYLNTKGIGVRSFWKPVHLQKPYEKCPRVDLTVTEHIWKRILTLPSSSGLSDRDLHYVLKTCEVALQID